MGVLTNLTKVQALLEISGDNTWLTQCITDVTADIERYCRWSFQYASSTTEIHSQPPDSSLYLFGRYPISTVTSVKESADRDWSNTTALTASTDYIVYPWQNRIERISSGWTASGFSSEGFISEPSDWISGKQVIQVIYVGGFNVYATAASASVGTDLAGTYDLDTQIIQAATYEVAARYRTKGMEGVVRQVSQGGQVTILDRGILQQRTMRLLDKFQRKATNLDGDNSRLY